MAAGVDFYSPSMRASGGDLSISISPLGLVELADEEFEIHGPRLNRYSNAWAFYLGYHWMYRREAGESQLVFNYVQAIADWLNSFTFSKGVHFQTSKQFEHIVPALLNRVWEVDNGKDTVLWEMGQQGGVSGDCFVKVAYEPAFTDSVGGVHPGRVRVLPINSAYCFPEWHPHDRDRLIRLKIKYRFWGRSMEGTRQVFTYTEILTDDFIEEYVNDELIDQRPNPIGQIPVIHIPNISVSGSPWGLSDVNGLIPLNREFNEKATEISDIVAYHAAPVTIIVGAKASNLEKGPKKVWGGLPKDSQVYNLENGVDLAGPMAYLQLLKTAIHEMSGVPETALGQAQPISNTSGVALAIQYQPAMNKYAMKRKQYSFGLQRINELILRTLFTFEPETLVYDPDTDGIIQEGQPPVLNPADPLVYKTECEWPPPLPVDILIRLNEIQAKMALGLESKRGALKDLGEEFVDEKLQELFEEQLKDVVDAGAMELRRAQINAVILALTGMVAQGDGAPVPQDQPDSGTDSKSSGTTENSVQQPPPLADLADLTAEELKNTTEQLVTQAYGTKLPQRRNPDTKNN